MRTLAEDFGKQLHVGAHLAELRRTRVGDFPIQQAKTLEQVKVSFAEEALGTILHKPDAALSRLPFLDLSADDVTRVRRGLNIPVEGAAWADGERVRMRDEHGHLVAVAEFSAADGSLHPSVVIAAEPS